MSVEIVVLSGSRQGDRIRINGTAFSVGSEPTDSIHFDLEKDPGVRGRRILFQLDDEGWKARSIGRSPPWLRQEVLEGNVSIRSGDIVRMSEDGPDFGFYLESKAGSSSQTSRYTSVQPAATPESPQTVVGSAAAEKWRRVSWFVAALVVVGILIVLAARCLSR